MFTPREPLTKENILSKITSYDIFKFYCEGFFKLGVMFKSPLRVDNNPSASIIWYQNDLIFSDFGEGSYRAISFVMRRLSLNYGEALQRINIDFNLGLGSSLSYDVGGGIKTSATYGKMEYSEKKPTIIRIKTREFTKKDLEYWKQYTWTKEMLVNANITSLSHFWIDSDKLDNELFTVGREGLTFSFNYYYNNNIFRRKIYSPLKKDIGKWWSNVDNTVVQGFHLLPKEGGNLLIITSSLKDCGIFWNLGYNSIAPNNEESLFPLQYINKLMNRWSRIILWFDNDFTKVDNPGIKNAKKFNLKYGFEYFYTPDNTEKDPSDYVKHYGLQEFKQLVESKL